MARKCAKRCKDEEDRIKQLPRDILVCIISYLPLKEAGRASVLAKYWDGLWVFSAQLDFDASQILERLYPKYPRALSRARLKYVEWVDKVVKKSHRASRIDEFRIQFYFGNYFRRNIDEWISYAFSKRVQRLDICLSLHGSISPYNSAGYGPYRFPTRLLLDQNSCFLIRSLSLSGVQVSQKDVDLFLCKFPFLEHLKLFASDALLNLQVCGSSLALKHLEIYGFMDSIVIRDTNLVSLKFSEVMSHLVVENIGKLVHLGIGHSFPVRNFTPQLSAYLPRLQVFSFAVAWDDLHMRKAIDFPEMTELKQLKLIFQAGGDESLMAITSLIRSSPNLEKLVVKVCWVYFQKRLEREYEKSGRHPLRHLKEVEYHGYCGGTSEDELVMYLLDNAVALEKVTVDTKPVAHGEQPREIKAIRKRAKQLKRGRPSNLVQFLII